MFDLPSRLQPEFRNTLAPGVSSRPAITLETLESACAQREKGGTPEEPVVSNAVHFMIKILTQSAAGHTIFGNKPISTLWVHTTSPQEYASPYPTHAELLSWQEVLIRAKLISNKFIARLTHEPSSQTSDRELLIYNRKAVTEKFTQHQSLFRARLGGSVSAESVLNELDHTPQLHTILNGDIELRGILLGYSQRAAEAFARREMIGRQLGLNDSGDTKEFGALCAATDGINQQLKDEFRGLSTQLKHGHQMFLPDSLGRSSDSVRFKTFPDDQEALVLYREYQKNQEYFRELVRENRFIINAFLRWGGVA